MTSCDLLTWWYLDVLGIQRSLFITWQVETPGHWQMRFLCICCKHRCLSTFESHKLYGTSGIGDLSSDAKTDPSWTQLHRTPEFLDSAADWHLWLLGGRGRSSCGGGGGCGGRCGPTICTSAALLPALESAVLDVWGVPGVLSYL